MTAQLKGFEDRQTVAHKKRRAETKLMRLQDVESTKLERNDPSASIAHDVVANVAPAISECIVTNESNIFYSNFCVDLTEKLRLTSSSCSIPRRV